MAREGVDLYSDIGKDPEEMRQAILDLRADFESLKDSDFLKILALIVSNISVTSGEAGAVIGTIGRDPKSQNIWGMITERGYGFHARYSGANYARFFVDAGNDSGHSTPSTIIDMPEPNKLVFKDNEGFTIVRLYGRGGQEVGFPTNYFTRYGALDLFAPFRMFQYNYGGGTAGGPEADVGYNQEGFMYQRLNYGASNITDIRVFNDGTWRSVKLFHPEEVADNPFVAETITVRESVTVEIS